MRDGLIDRFGRRIEYLRLSVTDRCDMRCRYCIPDGFCSFASAEKRLSPGEIERVARVFAGLGVRRIRLTGGEPLTRSDLCEIASRLSGIPGIDDLSLSTNGTGLARKAAALRAAGIRRINVSLDTLRRERFLKITGRDAIDSVLAGLEAARTAGFRPIKLNAVILPETEETEIDEVVEYARRKDFILRLIEAMPIGPSGRAAGFQPLQQVRARLEHRYGLMPGVVPGGGPARYIVSADGRFSIGFISALSQHFCDACNRVRLTADGRLLLCLGSESGVDLRGPLRTGRSEADLYAIIRQAITAKPRKHEFEAQARTIDRIMAQTGG